MRRGWDWSRFRGVGGGGIFFACGGGSVLVRVVVIEVSCGMDLVVRLVTVRGRVGGVVWGTRPQGLAIPVGQWQNSECPGHFIGFWDGQFLF